MVGTMTDGHRRSKEMLSAPPLASRTTDR